MTKPSPTADPAAVSLASRRKRVAHVCVQCGTAFEGLPSGRFCSDACRVKAYLVANPTYRADKRRDKLARRVAHEPTQ